MWLFTIPHGYNLCLHTYASVTVDTLCMKTWRFKYLYSNGI